MNKITSIGVLAFPTGLSIVLIAFMIDSKYNGGKMSVLGSIGLTIGASLAWVGFMLSTLGAIIDKKQYGKKFNDFKKVLHGNN